MYYLFLVFLLITTQINAQDLSTKPVGNQSFPTIGIIADCQYADQPTKGIRHYQLSTQKLTDCVNRLNTLDLDHVFHLGDLIDQHFESFETILPIINRLQAPYTLVLGNHDFSVEDQFKEKVPTHMGLEQRYFTITIKGWRFVVLDGNDISLYAWSAGSLKAQQAASIYQEKYSDREIWNGAIGDSQLQWLKDQLDQAESKAEKVVLLCHFPILPDDNHVLWNDGQVLDLVSRYSCVKAWFNGHNHAGGYANYRGIHFVTFKGMVDTDKTSYSTVVLRENELLIEGFGREGNQDLELK